MRIAPTRAPPESPEVHWGREAKAARRHWRSLRRAAVTSVGVDAGRSQQSVAASAKPAIDTQSCYGLFPS